MAKVRITQTNGASAEDISAAIGEFLKQQEQKTPTNQGNPASGQKK